MRRAFCFSRSWPRYSDPWRMRSRPCSPGRVGAAVAVGDRLGDGALHRVAALPLQEELGALPAAEPADGSGVSSHGGPWFPSFPSLHPPPLLGAAAVVRDGGDVLDAGDLDAGGGQRADGGLAARARARGPARRPGARRAPWPAWRTARRPAGRRTGWTCAEPLKPDVAGRGPGEDVALGVGDRDDGVVERALDVGDAEGDVLALALAGPAGRPRAWWAWPLLAHLLLSGDGLLRALAGAGVGVGALAVDRAGPCGGGSPGSSRSPSSA